ncbi:MAG: hypothetical protein ACRCU3_09285 [Eubacteriaceae bacterium]
MNQTIRKRRFTAIETAVLGNILYLVFVAVFKALIDIVGRDGNFNYLFNGIELLFIGLFWIFIFANNFKKIYAGEKPGYVKYIFFTLIPVILLTSALVSVSMLTPGSDPNSVWNQFAFLAAPTIFWYLPFGLVYEFIGNAVPIYVFYGVSLLITVFFQVLGMIIGRMMGRKYWNETKLERQADEENDRVEKKSRKRNKKIGNSKGEQSLSEPLVVEKPIQEERNIVMTQVIIPEVEDVDPYEEVIMNEERRTTFSENIQTTSDVFQPSTITEERPEIEIENVSRETFGDFDSLLNTVVNEKEEKISDTSEWQMTTPIEIEKIQEELNKKSEPKINNDKSFFMETSQIRIINEEDIEEYYRNKK